MLPNQSTEANLDVNLLLGKYFFTGQILNAAQNLCLNYQHLFHHQSFILSLFIIYQQIYYVKHDMFHLLSRNYLPFRSTWVPPHYWLSLCHSIFSFLCCDHCLSFFCLFHCFPFANVLSILNFFLLLFWYHQTILFFLS